MGKAGTIRTWTIWCGDLCGPQPGFFVPLRIVDDLNPVKAATHMLRLPAGLRMMYVDGFDRASWSSTGYADYYWTFKHPSDKYNGKWGLWHEHGVADAVAKWEWWWSRFAAAGGKIDHLQQDDEWNNLFDNDEYMGNAHLDINPNNFWPYMVPQFWVDQQANPKWNTFQFLGKTMPEWMSFLNISASDLQTAAVNSWWHRGHQVGLVLYQIAVEHWKKLYTFDIPRKYFPDLEVADYRFQNVEERFALEPQNENPYSLFWMANKATVNVQTARWYTDGHRPENRLDGAHHGSICPGGWAGHDVNPLEACDFSAPFPHVIKAVNNLRAMLLSNPGTPIMPWVAFPGYYEANNFSDPPWVMTNSDYWPEFFRQLCYNTPTPRFFSFNVQGSLLANFYPTNVFGYGMGGATNNDYSIMSGVIQRAKAHCRSARWLTPVLTARIPYTSTSVVSAVTLEDSNVGRGTVTFAPGVDSVDVTINEQTIHVVRRPGEHGADFEFGG